MSPLRWMLIPSILCEGYEMNAQLKILFMGTPEFAVPSLNLLIENGLNIIAVVTQPDRPKGRGRKHEAPPVKIAAGRFHLPVLQPERVRDEAFLQVFRELAPDMVVLVAFGQILPKEIIESPPHGCINLHPSLLPKYRGAAPMNWTLIQGETVTGVSIIEMVEKVDAGKILLQQETAIGPEETFGKLHDRLSSEGAVLLLQAIRGIMDGSITGQPQNDALATFAPRFKKEDTRIEWNREVHEIVNLVRGLSPSPAAYSLLDGRQLKVFSASGEECTTSAPVGTILPEKGEGLPVVARNGHVYLRDVQIEGKKRLPIREFLKGYPVAGKKLE